VLKYIINYAFIKLLEYTCLMIELGNTNHVYLFPRSNSTCRHTNFCHGHILRFGVSLNMAYHMYLSMNGDS